jgi:hypothetical protein
MNSTKTIIELPTVELADVWRQRWVKFAASLVGGGSPSPQAAALLGSASRHASMKQLASITHEYAKLLEQKCELLEALKPFTVLECSGIGSVPDDKVFLWKPQQTSKNLPGISLAHINAAKSAYAKATGRKSDVAPKNS